MLGVWSGEPMLIPFCGYGYGEFVENIHKRGKNSNIKVKNQFLACV